MISFELSPEEADLQRSTYRYAAEQVRPLARRCEEDGEVAASLVDAFWGLGLGQIGYPEAWGGITVGACAAVVVEEELSWGDAGIATGMPRVGTVGIVLTALTEGPPDTRIAPLLRGDDRCFAVLAWTGCTASEEREGLVLNGTILIPAVNRAEAVLVPCLMEEEIALVWLALPASGVQVSFDSHQLGLRAAPLGALSFEARRVSPGEILSRGETARTALRAGLERELLLLTARSVGTARAAFDYAARYATQRTAFGRAIADHQAIAFMLADMGIRVDAARALLWDAAWAADTEDSRHAAALKAAAGFVAEHVPSLTSDAVQVLGGHGYIQDHPVEKWMRDARSLANYIASVTNSLAALQVR